MGSALVPQVASRRRQLGLSAVALAARVGVSRQALHAIETGRSQPSTVTALRLARALGCRVDDLFHLREDSVPELVVEGEPGTRVALGQVDGRWVSHAMGVQSLERADGIVRADGSIEPLGELSSFARTALVAGCAPVLGLLADRSPHAASCRWLSRSSGAALRALAEGRVHVAGLHLTERVTPEGHDRLIREALGGRSVEIVTLVGWREGLVVAPGNPHGVRSARELEGLRIASRPPGAGATRVLRDVLSAAGLPVPIGRPVSSHRDAALAVLHGGADAAVVVEPIAEAFGLPFVPLVEEAFELAIPVEYLDHEGVRAFLDRLASARFAREARCLGAYDTTIAGSVRRLCA